MLSKKQRIPRTLFAEILKSRKFKNSPHFTLRIEDGGERPRAAVSVSKKISRSAVARNSTRRRVYSVIKNKISDLRPGLYLLIAKPGAPDTKGSVLDKEIHELLNSQFKE
ncbi:ribonuclease P protein component [Candidatus Parcubacteria bacterium]|nr:ribonuclease P protein component [Candidatus Parcubacteria bacterium]